MKVILLSLTLLLTCAAKTENVKTGPGSNLHIPEPSDICTASDGGYFVVSDNGILFKLNQKFEIEKKAKVTGFDFEGVYANDTSVFVSDESLRQIYVYNSSNLELQKIIPFMYNGGRNLGMESITYDPSNGNFVGFSEKEPCLLMQFNKAFQLIDQHHIEGLREVSSVTYYQNALWVLSDEERTIYKVDPTTFSIENKWVIPILNPEGICFTKEGNLKIVSDDQEEIFDVNITQ